MQGHHPWPDRREPAVTNVMIFGRRRRRIAELDRRVAEAEVQRRRSAERLKRAEAIAAEVDSARRRHDRYADLLRDALRQGYGSGGSSGGGAHGS